MKDELSHHRALKKASDYEAIGTIEEFKTLKRRQDMTINNYQELAMRTNDKKSTDRLAERIGQTSGYNFDMVGALLNGALGLTGEAGEVADIIKKYVFHGHNIRLPELIKELGDVCWYIALISSALGVDLEVILRENIKKLENRYPEGFSSEASINRSV